MKRKDYSFSAAFYAIRRYYHLITHNYEAKQAGQSVIVGTLKWAMPYGVTAKDFLRALHLVIGLANVLAKELDSIIEREKELESKEVE